MSSPEAEDEATTNNVGDVGLPPEEQALRGRLRSRLFADDLESVKIGRFVVVERIGKGGLGVVYSAYDPELDRRVAVKVVAPTLRHDEQASEMHARLHREARAMAKLAHPNVVTIYDVGEHGGNVFVAMELIEGQTLRSWWNEAGNDWRRKRDLFVGAAEGLAAAHDKGIVHRDFKPSNVLVSGDPELARVLDFGLARPAEVEAAVTTEAHPAGLSVITGAGSIVGTPAYMAPEQAKGAAVDPRGDQFSFSFTMWEALFGHRPFGGDDLESRLLAIERGPPAAPVRSDAPPTWLTDALRRGLANAPEDRFGSMRELISALTRDRQSRRWLKILVGVGVGLAAVVGGGAVWWAESQPDETIAGEVEELADAAYLAAAKSYFVYPPAEEPEYPTAYAQVLALEGLDGDAAELGELKADELRQEFAGTLARLGDTYWERDGGRPFAIDYYAAALVFVPDHEVAKERAPLTLGELVSLRSKAASGEFTPAELDAAETLHALATPDEATRKKRVRARLKKKGSIANTSTDRLLKLAGVKLEQSQPAAAKPDEPAPKPLTKEAAPPPKSDKPATADQRKSAAKEVAAGKAAFAKGNYTGARAHYHRALELDSRSHAAQAGLGALAFDRGRYQEAVRHFKRAVSLAPRRGGYWLQLGDANLKIVEYDAARRAYEKARSRKDSRAQGRLKKLDARVGRPSRP